MAEKDCKKKEACTQICEKYGIKDEPLKCCFLCEQHVFKCDKCELAAINNKTCLCESSYYRLWVDEKDLNLKRALALRIAKLA